MTITRVSSVVLMSLAAWFSLVFPVGCGEVEHAEQPLESGVDSRYTSAESLIDYYNSFASSDPLDFSEYVKLLYAENDLQKRLIQGYKTALPVLDLSTAVRQRFNESLVEDSDNYTTKPSQEPGRIVEHDGERAEAVYVDATGLDGRIYLVKIGDRWWISGYTLEYDTVRKTDQQSMVKSEAYGGLYAAISPGLLQRLQGGEFATIQQFRAALRAAMGEQVRRDPDRYRILFFDD